IKVGTKSSLLRMSARAPEPSSRQHLKPKNRSKKVARLVTSEVVRLRCLRTKTEPMLTGEPKLFTTRRQRDDLVTPSGRGPAKRQRHSRYWEFGRAYQSGHTCFRPRSRGTPKIAREPCFAWFRS